MNRFACLVAALILPILTFAAEPSDFTGTWKTNWGLLVLEAEDAKITGEYTGQFNGTVEGEVKDDGKFHYTWKQTNGEWGSGVFTVSESGKLLTGTWGAKESETNGGDWNGERKS